VWGADVGPGMRSTLYSHMTHLRAVIADAATAGGLAASVQRRSGGYLLLAPVDAVDLVRSRRLAELARTSPSDPAVRAALLTDALALWRGEPLTGVTGTWAENLRHVLTQQRIALLTQWAEQENDLGSTTSSSTGRPPRWPTTRWRSRSSRCSCGRLPGRDGRRKRSPGTRTVVPCSPRNSAPSQVRSCAGCTRRSCATTRNAR
jgi:Bacterial transcriptional activator domain